MSSIKHYIRFGSHKEAKILRDKDVAGKSKKKRFGLTFNANVVAHTPASISRFLYIHFKDTNYFIDPQTYIVQLDPLKYYSSTKIVDGESVTQVKASIATLFKQYGGPVKKIIDTTKKLEFNDLRDSIQELTEGVTSFQKNYLKQSYEDQKEAEGYSDYDDGFPVDTKPEFFIPPYFFLTVDNLKRDGDKWLDLNIEAIKGAQKINGPGKIAGEIVLEKQVLLQDSYLEEIIGAYKGVGVDTLLIWLDKFDETEVSEKYLERYIEFVDKLKDGKKGRKIINLYGGYFSLALSKQNKLDGLCHGPGYGEHRGVKPVGGGIPTAKFYYPALARRIDFELALSILKKKNLLNKEYFHKVCGCKKCREILAPDPDEDKMFMYGNYELSRSGKTEIPTEQTLTNNQLHYLLRRLEDVEEIDLDAQKQTFADFIKWNDHNRIVSTQHLENWLKFI